MKKSMREMDRLEGSLTPKQAILVWLEEIAHCQDLFEFVSYLRSLPESARPLCHLPAMMEQSVNQAMKGQPEETIRTQRRKAVRDVAFLVYLHRHLIIKATEPQRERALRIVLICEWTRRIIEEHPEHSKGSKRLSTAVTKSEELVSLQLPRQIGIPRPPQLKKPEGTIHRTVQLINVEQSALMCSVQF